MDCLDRDTYMKTSWLVPVMWVMSNLWLVFHYTTCHTWSNINGPVRGPPDQPGPQVQEWSTKISRGVV